ncbi:MAG TPA: hypothetical protein VH063_17510 [Gaiellaceae bacterium]|jgi:hypothetical protein|nr:hypothetical protein [Gaiellaceae bacterium]
MLARSGAGESTFVGCTIVARNYLSFARVLSSAWAKQHEQVPFVVLVIDDDVEMRPAEHENQEFVRPEEIGIDPGELDQMRGIYDVAEMTTALKPRFVRHLLERGSGAVVYLDSDMDLLGPVHELAETARTSGVALSPHLFGPPPTDAFLTEIDYAMYGQYNSGLIAVGASAREFVDWWARRTRWDCLFDEPAGLHADQRWLDCVPVYFEHAVIGDAGLNVAAWNLHERPFALEGERPTVAGVPLRAFHFAGFDPHRPERVTAYAPSTYDNEPILLKVRHHYAERLLAAGYDQYREIPYRYRSTASGRPLGRWDRLVYREALMAVSANGGPEIPGPFDASRSEEFERMLAHPRSLGVLTLPQLGALENARVRLRNGGWDRRRLVTAIDLRLRARLR